MYSPAPADLNLDGAGKPLSFSTAIRGPHGKEWTLADEQELIKLLVTLQCLLPVMRPAETPTYLKRGVKEKWDEVNRLRKRRVRWTMGGDRIEIDYEVGTNTAALPTINALFHSIVSTHSFMATIDIVDYILVPFFPPLNLSVLMCLLSLSPPSQNLASFLSSATPTANPSYSVMFSRLSLASPNLASCPNSVLSPSLLNTASLRLPPPCSSDTTPTPPLSP